MSAGIVANTQMASSNMPNIDLLAKLNAQQREAVTLKWGPALVIAGAGSGKTTVLTRRIAYLMSHLNQDAESILAVTFTNKAAAEMKHRIQALVGYDLARRLTIGTFHSVCARILRVEMDEYTTAEGWRWNKNFVIYDETDSVSILKAAVQKLNLDPKVYPGKAIKYKISALKNDGLTSSQFASTARTYEEQRLSEIFSVYQADLARNNALDFDDLILIFTELLTKNPAVLARQRGRYRHLLVDEFQDTNKSQSDLVSMLAGPKSSAVSETNNWQERSLMVVGDVDQSIYSWRKADFRIILGFQDDYKEAQLIKLEENYRSTETILDIANSIIVNNTERLEKVLRCNRGKGSKGQVYEAQDEIDEAFYVVEELKRLKTRDKKLSEAVILYRTNMQSRAIEEVLVRNHMPYTVVGGTRFYDRQEIKDVIAYLKLIYNGRDGQAFNRVINVPKRGIGKTTLDKLIDYADKENISMLEAAASATRIPELSPKVSLLLIQFANLVSRWQNMQSVVGISQLLEMVMSDIRYIQKLEEDAESAKDELALGRIENVREFINVAKEFESTADEPNLDSFLTRISLVSDLDSVKNDEDTVKLMTLHSAKGLEFSVVFLMGLEEGLFPHMRSLDSPAGMEEERRLMYVGVTRAADLLYMTLARRRMSLDRSAGNSPQTRYTVPSRFLKEIDAGLLQGYYPAPEPAAQPDNRNSGNFQRGNGFGERFNFGADDDDRNDRYANRSNDYEENSKYGDNSSFGGNSQKYGSGSQNSGGTVQRYGSGSQSYGGNSQKSGGTPQNYGSSVNGRSSGAGYGDRRPANSGPSQNNSSNNSNEARPSGANYADRRPVSGSGQGMRAMRPGTTDGDSRFASSNPRDQDANRPPSAADNSFEKLEVGDLVQHIKFGTGKVVKVIGDNDKQIYDVLFDTSGKKLLDPKFAKLIKLS